MIKEFHPKNVYSLIKKDQLFKSFNDDNTIWKIYKINDSDIFIHDSDNIKNKHCFQLEDVIGSFIEGVWIALIDLPDYINCANCNFRNEYVQADQLEDIYYCYKCRIGF